MTDAARSGRGSGRTIAITHVPSPALERGERTHVGREPIDFALAVEQHRGYRAMLESCGAEVVLLDVNRELPDSVFLEDTAIVLDEVAIVTPMGAQSRRPEPDGIAATLGQYRELRRIALPATIEGGDVVCIGRTILVGLSSRTNREGVDALRAIGGPLGYEVRAIAMRDALHFKSACTALPDGRLLVNPSWIPPGALDAFDTVPVAAEDPWGANVALVNGVVCAATEHAPTNDRLAALGYDLKATPLSEFAKAEGAVTCMSLIVAM
jgi:dimethylargininase